MWLRQCHIGSYFKPQSRRFASMNPLTQGLLIGFFGSGLYFAVDRYEPDRALAFMLKLLVVMWGALPCFTAAVCLATDFSSGRATRFKTAKLCRSQLDEPPRITIIILDGVLPGLSTRWPSSLRGERRTRAQEQQWPSNKGRAENCKKRLCTKFAGSRNGTTSPASQLPSGHRRHRAILTGMLPSQCTGRALLRRAHLG